MPIAQRKRPFALVLALLGALALGTIGARAGWGTVEAYREPIDPSAVTIGIADEADRSAVTARFRTFVQAFDANKKRGWPLGVATFLLGGAVFVFAMRTLGGSGAARAALVQLVVAQAGIHIASFWLNRDADEAYIRYVFADAAAVRGEKGAVPASFQRILDPLGAALWTLSSGAVLLGLTVRRSREFFDSSTAAVHER